MSIWEKLGGYDNVHNFGIVGDLGSGRWQGRTLSALSAHQGAERTLILHYHTKTFPFGTEDFYFEVDAKGLDALEAALRSLGR